MDMEHIVNEIGTMEKQIYDLKIRYMKLKEKEQAKGQDVSWLNDFITHLNGLGLQVHILRNYMNMEVLG